MSVSAVSLGSLERRLRIASVVVLCLVVAAIASPVTSARAAASDSDVAYTGMGDQGGFHLYKSSAAAGWHWKELATLMPGGDADDSWTGYECTTGDGRFVVAVVAPRHVTNNPELSGHGATAYAVSTTTGAAKPLISGIALRYYSPGCGAGDLVAISRFAGSDEQATTVFTLSAGTGRVLRNATLRGQFTSAVPTAKATFAAQGGRIAKLVGTRTTTVGKATGQAFDLRADPNGGIAFLSARPRNRVELMHLGTRLRSLGFGDLAHTSLLERSASRPVVVSTRSVRGFRGAAVRATGIDGAPRAISKRGSYVVDEHVSSSQALARSRPATLAGVHVEPSLVEMRSGRRLKHALPKHRRPATVKLGPFASDRAVTRAAPNTTTPKCAVPRNDLRRQVPQPNSKEVNWAIQQAVRGNLKGSVLTRPSNFLNMNLASYQPSIDFAPPTLAGGGSIPPSVVQALYAQESNFRQASFHALPGVSGNPIVADYYGSAGGDSSIDFNNADCGYGVSQITDPMTAASTALSANGKTKVAVDYTENIAAGIQILGDKWNQLYNAGVKINNADPQYLENWYGAIWAYNSGFHPNTGGRWGLGWTNNPANADYPPNRPAFLRLTYADAAHPADWPYQERVLGFMESPFLNYKGQASYAPPLSNVSGNGTALQYPGTYAFCDSSNECSSNYKNANNSLSYCTRTVDRECWWHSPSTFVSSCTTQCHRSQFTFSASDAEPSNDDNYPPACNSTLPTDAVIVDDQPTSLNVEGCSSPNWTSQGTFTYTPGTSSGVATGVIDWHQIGTGFGGHTFFTHNRSAGDSTHAATGTWTPPNLTRAVYNVLVHVPVSGATTHQAMYTIISGDGTQGFATINQEQRANQWVSLGDFTLQPGAKVVLTNGNVESPDTTDVAFDAVGFVKVRAAPPAHPSDASLAQAFKPALLFDSSEKWRPLSLDAFVAEKNPDGTPRHNRCVSLIRDHAAELQDDHVSHSLTDADGSDLTQDVPYPGGGVSHTYPTAHCAPLASLSDIMTWTGSEAFIDINGGGHSDLEATYASPNVGCRHDGILDCNGDEVAAGQDTKSAIYYHVGDDSAYTFIQYWMFYRYNSFSDTYGVDKHEGDWEAFAVAPSIDQPLSFDYASFSEHGIWVNYMRSLLECTDGVQGTCGDTVNKSGSHIKVYVANGSQATYPFSCNENVAGGCGQSAHALPERGHDGTRPWGHNGTGSDGLLAMPRIGDHTWADWAGHWGATAKAYDNQGEGGPTTDPGQASPRTPSKQSMWSKPYGECAFKPTSCDRPAGYLMKSSSGPKKTPVGQPSFGSPGRGSSCDSWFGDRIAALVCGPSELTHEMRTRSVRPSNALKVFVKRKPRATPRVARSKAAADRTAASAALAQVLGAPLEIGDSVTIRGTLPAYAVLRLHVANRGKVAAISRTLGSRGTTLTVVRRGARLALSAKR